MRWLSLSLPLVVLAACSSNDIATVPTPPSAPAPTAGWLTVQLITPNGNDGAVQFSVTGPGLDSVVADTYASFSTVTSGTANVVVTGSVTNGTLARIHVPDVSATSAYTGSVTAAAARTSYQLQDLTGYRIVVVH